MELLRKNSENSCQVLTKSFTTHMETIPTGKICFFLKFPITAVKTPHFRSNGFITLIHLVVHAYHPDITDLNSVHYQHQKKTNNFREMSQIFFINIL